MKRFIAKHSPLFILAGLCVAMALYSQDFRTGDNLKSVADRTAVVGILATGELAAILTAGIDLSVGSVAALSGAVGCIAMKLPYIPMPLAVLIGALVGLTCGLINGGLITLGRIPPFIVTLGMMMVARGMTLLVTGGVPVFGLPESFGWIGGKFIWWIPVLITVVLAGLFAIALRYTRFGRSIYAIGGNRQAARLSGIPVNWVCVGAYAFSGLMAGIAGMVLSSRTTVASPNAAEMYELDAIAACVIGGASLMGGEGNAIATLAGALIIMVLRNFCNLEDIQVEWQPVIVGTLIVALVFYDNMRKRQSGLLKDD